MKLTLRSLVATLFFAGMAVYAAPTDCGLGTPPVGGSITGLTFTCAGLTFSNFDQQNAGGPAGFPNITFAGANYVVDATGITVNVQFSPNISTTTALGLRDAHFFFTVSGAPITMVDLGIQGFGATVGEFVCSQQYTVNAVCPGTNLASTSVKTLPGGSLTSISAPFAPDASIGIYKDILVDPAATTDGQASLTTLTQSFHFPGAGDVATPEPATFALIGGGLALLGLARRRQRSA